MSNKVLLVSGGMDSFLLAHEPELKDAKLLFVHLGQNYVTKELKTARKLAVQLNTQLECITTNSIADYEHSSGIIPFRNAELLLCAAQYATDIYFGVIEDEINSDKSEEFVTAMEAVLNISHKKQYWTEGKIFKIHTPFRHLSKTDLIKRYLVNGNSLEKLLETVSCYDTGDKHCGKCSSCFKRWVALTNALECDISEQFVQSPYWYNKKHLFDFESKGYSQKRIDEITNAISFVNKAL